MKKHQKGSALILVLLISLVLSAFGIVALRDIAIGTQQSAGFRVRTQANQISNAGVDAFSMRTGNKANHYLSILSGGAYGEDGTTGTTGIFGGNLSAATLTSSEREAYATHGGFVFFDDASINTSAAGLQLLPGATAAAAPYENETGLFTTPGFNSFEARDPTEWRVILRNVSAGFPAPGYSDRYCFRRGTVAASAQVGTHDPNWDQPTNVGLGIHATEVFLGPIPCGYN